MSKPVKALIRRELVDRLQGVTSLAVVGFAGVDAVTNNRIRGRLRGKEIRMMVVKNSLARQAFKEVGLGDACVLLNGPCALAYGTDPEQVGIVNIVRELLDLGKETPSLTVKAAMLDGEVFGAERIQELSQFPTREEAIAELAGCVVSAGGGLAACLLGPGSQIAGVLKTIEENEGAAAEAA